jgi:hypothetical protein
LSVSRKVFVPNEVTCFPLDQIESFFKKTNCMDEKRLCQLA